MRSMKSKRLLFELVKEDDLDNIFKLHSNDKVMKYIREPDTNLYQSQQKILELQEYSQKNSGYGLWCVKTRESHTFIGWVLLIHIELDTKNPIEVGYRLFPEYWGQGYATEMALKMLEHSKYMMKLRTVSAITKEENKASIRVLDKCGFRYIGPRFYYGVEVSYFEKELS